MKTMRVYSAYPRIGEKEKQAVMEVLNTGMLTQHEQTRMFEKEISEYIGCKYTTVVNSGTSALMAALWAHGIGRNGVADFVSVPTYTFIGTVGAVRAVGAVPVFMDCNRQTFNVDPEEFSGTKAAIIVDVAGLPCDSDEWNEKCKDLILIEDAAEAFGARYKYRMVGNDSHTTIFSFYMTKPIQTVEGGAICTNDPEIDRRVKELREHGQDSDRLTQTGEYHHQVFGLNLRTTDIQSVIGRVQLHDIEQFMRERNVIVNHYRRLIREFAVADKIWFQDVPGYATRHPYCYVMMVCETDALRDKILQHLRESNIESRVCWKPVHMQPAYSRFSTTSCPNSEWLYSHSLTLPIGNAIPQDAVDYVIEKVKEAVS